MKTKRSTYSILLFLLLWTVPTAAKRPEPDLSTLMLTWQSDPTSTMTIQWLQDAVLLPTVAGASTPARPYYQVALREDASLETRAADDFAIHFFADDSHRPPEDPSDLSASLTAAASHEELLLWVDVTDDDLQLTEDPQRPWQGDSIELFLSAGIGSLNRYQIIFTPRVDPDTQRIEAIVYDWREPAATDTIEFTAELQRRETGYTIAIALPWKNLGIHATENTVFGLHLIVSDHDRGKPARWAGIHPTRGASNDPSAVIPIALGASPSTPMNSRTVADHDGTASRIRLYAPAQSAGKTVDFVFSEEHSESVSLQLDGTVAHAQASIPNAADGHRWGAVEIFVESQLQNRMSIPPWLEPLQPPPSSTLQYTLEGESAWSTVPVELTKLAHWQMTFLHRVELRDLRPDSTYRFRITDSGPEYTFRTMPETLSRPLRIAIGGDNLHQQKWFEQTNTQVMHYDVDFVAWGGDFAYADGSESNLNRWRTWFDAIANTLVGENNRLIPIVACIGNHEVKKGYYYRHEDYRQVDHWRAAIAPYFYQLFAFPGQPGYGALDFGDYLSILSLDTDHTNPIAGTQTEWLTEALKKRSDIPYLIPLYHVPAYPSNRPFDNPVSERVRQYWLPLFEQAGIRVAFEHHDHTYKRTHPLLNNAIHPHGIVYVGDGAWGVRTRSIKDTWYLARGESKRHAIIATLHQEQSHFIVIDSDGSIIDDFRIDARSLQ